MINLSWLKQSFSSDYKLLHVFLNTLYIAHMGKMSIIENILITDRMKWIIYKV